MFKSLIVLFFPLVLVSQTDPFESVNRAIHQFNEYFDLGITRPLAKTYLQIPEFFRRGVNNFFSNFSLPAQAFSYALAGEGSKAGLSLLSFFLNMSLGFGGILNPAEELRIKPDNYDLDLTLKCWGIDTGPYLVLPFVGPSSLRALIPSGISNLLSPDYWLFDNLAAYIFFKILDRRASMDELIEQAQRMSFDTYTFYKNFYLSQRSISFNAETEDQE